MPDIAELLKVLAPVVSILIAASAILQTLERGRRELAVNLIYNWANDTDWATSRSISIAKELPGEVINEINSKRGVSVPGVHYDGVISILRGEFPEKRLPPKLSNSETDFQITSEQSAFIHFLWVRWLNRLEGTLAAWQQGAADSELMAREFAPLVEGTEAELDVLTKVRKGLPVITEFCKQQEETGRIDVRPKLGIFPWHP